jgi:hypothetical protein
MLESLILSIVIDAKEHRDVCVVDIPHAFVQTPNEKVNEDHPPDLMKVKGRLAEVLVQMDPQLYAPYLILEFDRRTDMAAVVVLVAVYRITRTTVHTVVFPFPKLPNSPTVIF